MYETMPLKHLNFSKIFRKIFKSIKLRTAAKSSFSNISIKNQNLKKLNVNTPELGNNHVHLLIIQLFIIIWYIILLVIPYIVQNIKVRSRKRR